jgi:hypothetical protein
MDGIQRATYGLMGVFQVKGINTLMPPFLEKVKSSFSLS